SGTGYYGDTSAVKSTSMNRYAGGYATVNVWYFRGGGAGKESDEPLINSSTIYNSLFNKDAFASTFTPWTGDAPIFQHQINPWNFSLSKLEFMKIPLKVADVSRPVSIDNGSLLYFWSNSSLPRREAGTCHRYTSTNEDREFTVCDLNKKDRCAANISDLPHLAPFQFLSIDGEPLTQFSWMCKEGQVCCAWECCDPVNDWLTFFIISLVVIFALFGCAVWFVSACI
ncbi:hypothetical protein PMAYCL1PPCAC_20108, partial [Pristionchus mayeri]